MSESLRGRRWRRQRFTVRLLAAAGLVAVSSYLFEAGFPALTQRIERIVASRKTAATQLAKLAASRPVYPYSVIRGGVYGKDELMAALEGDPVAARHYAGFRRSRVLVTRAAFSTPVFLSYRVGNAVFWTSRPVRLPPGETVLTDGQNYARARCGNRISLTPQARVSQTEPAPEIMDSPEVPASEIADLGNWSDDRLTTFDASPAAGMLAAISTGPTVAAALETDPSWWTAAFPIVLLPAPLFGTIPRTTLPPGKPPVIQPVPVPAGFTPAAPVDVWPREVSPLAPIVPNVPGLPPTPVDIPITSTSPVPEPTLLAPTLLAFVFIALARFYRQS